MITDVIPYIMLAFIIPSVCYIVWVEIISIKEHFEKKNGNITLKNDNNLRDKYLDMINNKVNLMTGNEFEEFVEFMFSINGYKNKTQKTKASHDGGVDVILSSKHGDVYVECKRFKYGNNVGSPIVLKLIGACYVNQIQRCVVVTTSGFTTEALDIRNKLYNRIDIEYWDMSDILNYIVKGDIYSIIKYLELPSILGV